MMLSLFGTAGSALHASRTWLDATADNIANLDTMAPTSGPAFQARRVVVAPVQDASPSAPGVGAGVQVVGVTFGDPAGRPVYMPDSPLADAQGMVRAPDMDLGDEMVDMMVAQRAYQANLSVIDQARDLYQQAISIAG